MKFSLTSTVSKLRRRKISLSLFFNICLLLIIIANVALWIYRFSLCGSLWFDEAMFAVSIANRDMLGVMAGQYYYSQSAPLVFAVISKINLILFGHNECALRLLPLLAAICSLGMMYVLSKNTLRLRFPLFPVAFLATLIIMAEYSVEFKPYTFDVLVALTAIYLFGQYHEGKISCIWLCIWYAFLIWCSLSSLMIIGAICIYIFIQIVRDHSLKNIWGRIMPLFIVASSAVLCYLLWIYPTSNNIGETANEYWKFMRFPIIPTSMADSFKGLRMIVKFFAIFAGKYGSLGAFILILLGFKYCKVWYRNIIVLCGLLMIIASALGKFPFAERLWLFYAASLVPLICLTLEKLAKYIYEKSIVGCIVVLLIALGYMSIRTIVNAQIPVCKFGSDYRTCHNWVEQQMGMTDNSYEFIHSTNRPFTHYYTDKRFPMGYTESQSNPIVEGRTIWGGCIGIMHNTKPFEFNYIYDQDVLNINADAISKFDTVYIVSVHEDLPLQPLLNMLGERGVVTVPFQSFDSKVYMFERK